MLYIEDERGAGWPHIVRVLISAEPLDMVVILHAGEGAEALVAPFTTSSASEFLVRPPRSSPEGRAVASARVQVDNGLLSWLENHHDEFEDLGEALVLYPPRAYEFAAALIPHEGVVVVRNEYGSALAAAGVRLGEEPPDWWE